MTREDAEIAVRHLEATKDMSWHGLEHNQLASSNVVGVWAHNCVQQELAFMRLQQTLSATPPAAVPAPEPSP